MNKERYITIVGMLDTVPGFNDLFATVSEVMDPDVDPKDALEILKIIEGRMFDEYGYSDAAIKELNYWAFNGVMGLSTELEIEAFDLNGGVFNGK